MRFMITFITAVLPLAAMAANPPAMNEQDMQAMMQNFQKMAACMQEIKQDELDKLQKDAESLNNDLQALCKSGKRKQAQDRAIQYSKKMKKSPVVKQMQKCQAPMDDMIPVDVSDDKQKHVCDVMK